ncbi:MAG TPA: carboxypeptidase-like regulatory domain-containing protein [Bryobacteraceae bacterium]|nr:carboxypeptidase-like regulatory domain-containing protein [Bryobacteraceae bacterium]
MPRHQAIITSVLLATMCCAWAADVVVSGTVVDSSGAAIAGAAVEVQSANRTVLRVTESDMNGSFTISGLAAGNYRVVVSHANFVAKEIPLTIGTAPAPAPLRIALAVGSVSTTVNVQGREDDLDRPILRSGEVLETVPGLIITQHAGGGKVNQYFFAASISTTVQISPFPSTICR